MKVIFSWNNGANKIEVNEVISIYNKGYSEIDGAFYAVIHIESRVDNCAYDFCIIPNSKIEIIP